MGKTDFWAPKAIANRQKAKGLGRLRWYCQMCQKQCRDANGFKCHTQSEGHIRQMAVFKSSAGKFMDDFSREFERTFINTLSRRHNTKRVKANNVYQEMIQDRHHVHMNSTYWGSLSSFIKYLGQKGICTVEDTDEGWYIKWIDRDPRTLSRLSEKEKRKKVELDAEERHNQEMKRQMDAAKAFAEKNDIEEKFTELKDPNAKIELDLSFGKEVKSKIQMSSLNQAGGADRPEKKMKIIHAIENTGDSGKIQEDEGLACSARECENKSSIAAAKSETLKNDSKSRSSLKLVDNCWLVPGIVVKIITPKYGEELRKRKGVVVSVSTRDVGYGEIQLIDKRSNLLEKGQLRIKQSHVETVLPKPGGQVMIVSKDPSFPNRGFTGTLIDVDLKNCNVSVKMVNEDKSGSLIHGLEYENVCKVLLF